MSEFTTALASAADLADLVLLFDEYRQFYGKASDTEAAASFLRARMRAQESILFIARQGKTALGFTQLYPGFSSTALGSVFIRNDLYVRPSARRKGVGGRLLETAEKFAREQGAVRMTLATAVSNHQAQALYENAAWQRDDQFHVYHRTL